MTKIDDFHMVEFLRIFKEVKKYIILIILPLMVARIISSMDLCKLYKKVSNKSDYIANERSLFQIDII